jgi:hypothetical protein
MILFSLIASTIYFLISTVRLRDAIHVTTSENVNAELAWGM